MQIPNSKLCNLFRVYRLRTTKMSNQLGLTFSAANHGGAIVLPFLFSRKKGKKKNEKKKKKITDCLSPDAVESALDDTSWQIT